MPSEFGMQQLLTTVGSGAVLGGVLGFAAKKLLKLAAVLAALEAGLLIYLDQQGILNIYWSELDGLFAGGGGDSTLTALTSLAGTLPIGASLVGGFAVGFKIG
jgi:uncharacterized membrane protein (Fun14 family)